MLKVSDKDFKAASSNCFDEQLINLTNALNQWNNRKSRQRNRRYKEEPNGNYILQNSMTKINHLMKGLVMGWTMSPKKVHWSHNTQYLQIWPPLAIGSCRYDQLRSGHTGMGPESNATDVFIRKGQRYQKDSHVTAEAGIGAMHLCTKEHRRLPTNPRSQKWWGRSSPLQVSTQTSNSRQSVSVILSYLVYGNMIW